ncbi:MAG: phosphoglycerate kinase [Planctomycetota bacterium]
MATRLAELPVEGLRVLVRVDFNVPMKAGAITDDTRIRAALPTLRAILERGGTPILLSHLGRPKGQVHEELRLTGVGERLASLLDVAVETPDVSVGPEAASAVDRAIVDEGVVLLENVRFHPGETAGDMELAARFAELGDVFVNDAFGTCHRDHASVSGIARLLPSAAGLLLERELEAFERVLEKPARPFVAVLGGAKVSDKLPVVRHLLERVDAILIGGGMAYTFLEAQGQSVGASLVEREQLDDVRQTLALSEQHASRIELPSDHVVAEAFAEDSPPATVTTIEAGWMGLDIGPETRARYAEHLAGAKTIVWNGPMGVFEWPNFRAGTEAVGRAVAEADAYSVVGGGDSVAALGLLGLTQEVSHVSTGGGASLELLEGRSLPGIEALERSPRP